MCLAEIHTVLVCIFSISFIFVYLQLEKAPTLGSIETTDYQVLVLALSLLLLIFYYYDSFSLQPVSFELAIIRIPLYLYFYNKYMYTFMQDLHLNIN